jgi:hypothetical protein
MFVVIYAMILGIHYDYLCWKNHDKDMEPPPSSPIMTKLFRIAGIITLVALPAWIPFIELTRG